jgi:hypothetical protein
VNARSNSALGQAERYVVPAAVLDATISELHTRGGGEFEAFVLWGGMVSDDRLEVAVTSAELPEQTASSTADGLLVVVGGDALFEVNKHLHRRGELLVGQVHTHPGAAYHSPTDDDYPLVTLIGALSLVIPEFGRHGMDHQDRWAWYRLRARGVWDQLDPSRSIVIR